MKKQTWAWIAILVGMALPAMAEQRVTVAQLEQILASSQSMPDVELAAKLSDLRLTERFTQARLARWKAGLAGARSQRALLGLADRSAFLSPPAAELGTKATPDIAEQRRIMGLAATYVSKTIPDLPKFIAARTTIHFEDTPSGPADAAPVDGGELHAMLISHNSVVYRGGEEIVDPGAVRVHENRAHNRGLKTWGVFGPILGLVLLDAAENKLEWGHWEQSAGGEVAVFRYAVPKDRSHYEVRYCCIAESYGMESTSFRQMSAYHGEITVDPASGILLRLTLEADLEPGGPMSRAAIAVEYGPEELGGMTYICPKDSVSISIAKTQREMQDPAGHPWLGMGPPQMLLNHVVFEQYHLFRAETRVLSSDEERAAGIAPDATLPNAQTTDMPPSEEELADAPAAKRVDAAAAGGTGNAAPSVVGSETAEISTAEATGLPETAAHAAAAQQDAGAQAKGYSLRVTSRLVDVNVVAVDKKGRPITDLKPGDFEVFDNGVKQDVKSFSKAGADGSGVATAKVAETSTAPDQSTFTNHPAKDPKAGGAEDNTVVLLIDAGNLAYPDLAIVREQMLRFFASVPANERVAMYVSKYHGFQVLMEPTIDHERMATMLKTWRPSPQDVANAQDEEARNRQQIETVHNPEDMLSVNGNYTLDTGSQLEGLDPKLRELGSNPAGLALGILVEVAHHLAVLPGHKSLVWVTSDNALADWTKASVTIEKTSKYIEPAALRVQEAMNNAHVSVYPLDASHLEANVIAADTETRNVELTPTFQRPAALEHELEGPEAVAGQDMNPYIQNRSIEGSGRLMAQMEQDTHAIQGVFREVAEATGGRAMSRSGNLVGELNGVVAEGHATYLLGFAPSQAADGQYHVLTVKLVGHKDARVRYRAGYKYDKEPTTLKERFAQVVWEPGDASEIAVSTKPINDAAGNALRVTVAGTDLDLAQQSQLWTGKVDIFLVRRDEEGLHAKVTGQTVGLRLKPATYQRAMNEGLTFDERVEPKPGAGSLRIVVVDVNSGRIGSVTVPSKALEAKP